MFYRGKGIVKVVQESFPVLIFWGFSKSFGVVFESFPPYQENVAVEFFNAV